MWHIVVGMGILATVISLLCVGMYKLSGKSNICQRGKWSDNGEDLEENQLPVCAIGHVQWLELQVNDLVPNGEVPYVATIEAGG